MEPFFKPLPVGPFIDTFKNKNNFSKEENNVNKKKLSLSDVAWLPERESSDGAHLIIEDSDGHSEEYYLENMNQVKKYLKLINLNFLFILLTSGQI